MDADLEMDIRTLKNILQRIKCKDNIDIAQRAQFVPELNSAAVALIEAEAEFLDSLEQAGLDGVHTAEGEKTPD